MSEFGIRCRATGQMQKSLFIQAGFGNQVMRDTKYNTTDRSVVKGVRVKTKIRKQTRARLESES